ncbi:MAG: acetyl/propionyl/methylcrotonyl-CoA carboxylase subunit alpha [Dongiaceae bacterium]
MKKILIANRGEIACRIIASCRRLGIATVAVHSEADAKALHATLADAAVAIGPAPARQSYLVADTILKAARDSGADAIHPGYGFLAENPDFARRVTGAGLVWIGPTPESIEAMGDKERARAIAQAAGVPVLAGSRRFAVGATEGLEAAAQKVGFPLLVKAAAGGGGIGMRRVDAAEQLAGVVEATQALAAKSFGDGTIYLERLVERARHIEIQVFGFGDGRAVHMFERECSIQRRYQKILEESRAPNLPAAMLAAMAEAAVSLAATQRYRGAGTVEFIVDDDRDDFHFLEMNTRIQVEHPVTEMITGLDLVALQIRLAAGEPLAEIRQDAIEARGHAIEARIYAENPAKNFMPSPGPLTLFRLPPAGPSLRIDTGVREGDSISFHYDPMIAKMIAHGIDRATAIGRLLKALEATRIEGVSTNVAFLKRLVDHAAFRAGDCFTGFIPAHGAELL